MRVRLSAREAEGEDRFAFLVVAKRRSVVGRSHAPLPVCGESRQREEEVP